VDGLTERERKILFSLAAEYMATGEPVGSRTLARKCGLELSAASIRNVLSDLEDTGFLYQPHTSAGRVPTEKALRALIEALAELQPLATGDQTRLRRRINEIYGRAGGWAGERMRKTGLFLSEFSGAAALVATSSAAVRQLSQLRFIPVQPNQLLAVLVFADGMVENRYVPIDQPVDDRELERVHNLLAGVVSGCTLQALRELFVQQAASERQHVDAVRRQAFELGRRAVHRGSRHAAEVVITGQSRLMELPEYAHVDRLKGLVRALEERQHLVGLLDRTIDAGTVSVYVGSETGEGEFGEAQLSLVVAPYGGDDRVAGTVGVLGPTRMDYARMMPLVQATADAITDAMKKPR
jgi:heat-inducible transcriptional repressor